ncbi:unnamed protein product [Penicillium salamii]|nr:unnamed protein product [Penicillium salamii]CAG7962510.1 unnamed protein product [Penicillium salamii]CAG8275255.1 unnamed protein product [Penicillium salamii]
MCQNKCSPIKHPLAKARKTQAFLSLISWPCAFAAIFTAHGRAEAWLQLIAITISAAGSVFMLCRYRKTRSQTYATLEVAIDGFTTVLFMGIYIAGIVILATFNMNSWRAHSSYTLARAIPQIYSNLSCFLLFLAYLRSFAQGAYCRYIKQLMNARRGITYVICPSCDHTENSLNGQTQEMKGGEQDVSASGGLLGGLYTDHDVEAQPLLSGNTVVANDQQSTGIINKN